MCPHGLPPSPRTDRRPVSTLCPYELPVLRKGGGWGAGRSRRLAAVRCAAAMKAVILVGTSACLFALDVRKPVATPRVSLSLSSSCCLKGQFDLCASVGVQSRCSLQCVDFFICARHSVTVTCFLLAIIARAHPLLRWAFYAITCSDAICTECPDRICE